MNQIVDDHPIQHKHQGIITNIFRPKRLELTYTNQQKQQLIDLAIKLRKQFPNVGIALQANLYRTEKDLTYMMDQGVSIRLVKGAYKEHITKAGVSKV